MKKAKISLVSLLLFVALMGTSIEIFLRRSEIQSLMEHRNELLEESVRINATDTSKIYVRPLQSLAPMVYRFQVACPIGTTWHVFNEEGEFTQDGGEKRHGASSGTFELTDFKPGETHMQGVITIYFRKKTIPFPKKNIDRYMLFVSTKRGGGGSTISSKLDAWIARMFESPPSKFSIKHSKKEPVKAFPANEEAPLLQFFEIPHVDLNGTLTKKRGKFLTVSIVGT